MWEQGVGVEQASPGCPCPWPSDEGHVDIPYMLRGERAGVHVVYIDDTLPGAGAGAGLSGVGDGSLAAHPSWSSWQTGAGMWMVGCVWLSCDAFIRDH